MVEPDTFWLTVTNVALGLVVVVCLFALAGGLAWDAVCRRLKRRANMAEMDRDMRRFFGLSRLRK